MELFEVVNECKLSRGAGHLQYTKTNEAVRFFTA